jgi:hypothetical protein
MPGVRIQGSPSWPIALYDWSSLRRKTMLGRASAPASTRSPTPQATASAAAASGSPSRAAQPPPRTRREDLVGNPDAVRRDPFERCRTFPKDWPVGGATMKFGLTTRE